MAQITEYANFVVYFNNDAEYQFAVGLAGGTSVLASPKTFADIFGFVDGVNYNTGGPLNPDKGMYGLSPYGLATPPGPGYEVGFPAPSGKFLRWDVDNVIVPAQAGNPASIFPAGPDLNLVWCGVIIKQAANLDTTAPDVAPIPLRRFAIGFEWYKTSEGLSNPFGQSRDSSRTLDGFGLALREVNNQGTINVNKFVTPVNAHTSWERMYIRIRQFGSGDIDFWKTLGSPSPGNGIQLNFKPDGSIDVYNVNVALVATLLGNTGIIFTLDEFFKMDYLVEYNDGIIGHGRFRLFANGVNFFDQTVPLASAGIGANNTHASTQLGGFNSATGWEVDFDDWHNAEIPNILGTESLTSVDWILGTHIKASKVNTGNLGNWSGQLQFTNQMMLPSNVASTSKLTSSTSGDILEGVTDADDTSDSLGTVVCAAAAMATMFNVLASGSVAGALGYRLAGGSIVTEATAESTIPHYNQTFWPGTGTEIVNPTIVPASVVYEKAANTVLNTVSGLGLLVQYVGMWGFEDGSEIDFPRLYITHNSWFPNIAQAFLGPTPGPGLAAIQTGTYVGNGTTQSIQLPLPPCFLWIRPVGITNPGVRWFAASEAAHRGGEGGTRPDLLIRMDFDPDTGIVTFTVSGSGNECNANGQTYHYTAICDPSFFFNLCGAYLHDTSNTGAINPLIDSSFLALAGFIERANFAADSATKLIYKGPGHTGTTGSLISGTAVANVGSFGLGAFTSGADVQQSASGDQVLYSLFKQSDDCANLLFQIFSYTGDGTGARTITCTPTSGRFATFAYVQPHNAVGIIRDASDTGSNSHNAVSNASTALGITAIGMDSITVASNLNTNAIIYDVFIILGDTTGLADGTFFPAACLPTPLVTPPTPPIGLNILPEGGIILGGSTANTLLKNVSGIYTLVKDKRNDTLYDRQTGQSSIDVAIPNPRFKTGFIGG